MNNLEWKNVECILRADNSVVLTIENYSLSIINELCILLFKLVHSFMQLNLSQLFPIQWNPYNYNHKTMFQFYLFLSSSSKAWQKLNHKCFTWIFIMFNSFLSLFMSLDSDSYTVIITAEWVINLNKVKNDEKFFKTRKISGI